MKIINDINLIYDIFKYDVILVGTSIYNSLGNGFQHEIKINFPIVNDKNMETSYADPKKLGTNLYVSERNVIFALCYINSGRFRPDLKKEYLNYDALENCLKDVVNRYNDKKIATTLIGGSIFDGDGNREQILSIIDKICQNTDITIYDYVQQSVKDKNYQGWQEVKNLIGKVSKEEYYHLKNKFLWERKHGIWNSKSLKQE